MSHYCPANQGAHHFVADENSVRVCDCGEVELTPEEQMDLIEIAHAAKDAPVNLRLRARLLRLLGR